MEINITIAMPFLFSLTLLCRLWVRRMAN